MEKNQTATFVLAVLAFIGVAGSVTSVLADARHGDSAEHHHGEPVDTQQMLEQMKRMHGGHDHDHDFAAMTDVSLEEMGRVMGLMLDIGLALPPMDARHGRELFIEKGCIVCHQVNGIGGEIGPSLNASDMPQPMNAFEFAARMWRGAPAMIQMQQDLFGDAISLSGEELADIVAFAHDEAEQKKLAAGQIPAHYRDLMH